MSVGAGFPGMGGVYLSSMSFSRTTESGRRITATPRLRAEPDRKTLVALILHLADQLHAEDHSLAQENTSVVREDETDEAPRVVGVDC